MKGKGISQETLKLIACLTMIVDHIGAVLLPDLIWMRCIGRLSFPIYGFLIAEGSYYTRNPGKYGLRLLLLAVLSEFPYELALFGGTTPYRQNVMTTMLMGFCALEAMKRCPNLPWKILMVVLFALAAEFLKGDYRAEGVLVIVLFALTRELPHKWLLQFFGLALIFGSMASMTLASFGPLVIRLQALGALAVIPIALYSGRKTFSSPWVQWGFYLCYPLSLLIPGLIRIL